ncbi:type VII secretion target [Glycomyces sp. NPDC047369]
MQNSNLIPSAEAFETHAAGIKSKVVDRVAQAADAAQQKGYGDLLDFGIVNLPFAGGAADLKNKAVAALGLAVDGTEELAAQIKETGQAYHDNDDAVAQTFNEFTSETEQP